MGKTTQDDIVKFSFSLDKDQINIYEQFNGTRCYILGIVSKEEKEEDGWKFIKLKIQGGDVVKIVQDGEELIELVWFRKKETIYYSRGIAN